MSELRRKQLQNEVLSRNREKKQKSIVSFFYICVETTPVSTLTPGSTPTGEIVNGSSTTPGTGTPALTTERCEEMQAVDEGVSRKITVTPNELPKGENVKFQPTSPEGVSFDENDRKPTITVSFEKPSEVHSVTIPRDTTPNANVQQFEVTFYTEDGKKTTDKPILSEVSPADDKKKPATVDSTKFPIDKLVSRIEITIVRTTDDESPKGVVLDIKACVESTTGETIYLYDEYVF